MTGKHTACGAMLAVVGLGVLVVGIVAIARGFDTNNAPAASGAARGAGADDGNPVDDAKKTSVDWCWCQSGRTERPSLTGD